MRGKKRKPGPKGNLPAPASSDALLAIGVLLWSGLIHGLYLAGDALLLRPVSAFFFADGVHYLESARHLVAGTTADAGLPFHPPMMSWLLAPLWLWLEDPEAVFRASKVMMLVFNAMTYAAVFRLLRRNPVLRWSALPIALLLPLVFGEILLSSVANNEAFYRLLLALILLLGWRRPVVGGFLQAAATLTRAEHLVVVPLLLAVALVRPVRRRAALVAASTAVVLLLPYAAVTSMGLRSYNARHAATLPESLPAVVPVSFYGPLNFALAQTEEDIFFSRRSLPISRGAAAALDPNHPVHNAYIVHGYRVGLEAIGDDPQRFALRSLRKAVFSLRAFVYGWTWRDFPKPPEWRRWPVDMASSRAPVYEALLGALMLIGVWALRRERTLMAIGLGLVTYRLAINIAFFPYLRSMMIAAPFGVVLAVTGVGYLLRRSARPVLIVMLAGMAAFHLATAASKRQYLIAGERDAQGTIIDDRVVRLKYVAPDHQP